MTRRLLAAAFALGLFVGGAGAASADEACTDACNEDAAACLEACAEGDDLCFDLCRVELDSCTEACGSQ